MEPITPAEEERPIPKIGFVREAPPSLEKATDSIPSEPLAPPQATSTKITTISLSTKERLLQGYENFKSWALGILSLKKKENLARFFSQHKPRVVEVLADMPSTVVYSAGAVESRTATQAVPSGSFVMASGGLAAGVALPFAVYSTYDLIKNWRQIRSKQEKGLRIAGDLSTYSVGGKGVATVVSKVAMGAAKAAFVLGPIGVGITALVATGRGISSAVKASQLKEIISKAKLRHLSCKVGTLARSAMGIIRKKLTFERKEKILDSLRYFAIAIGLGFGALATAAVMATPLGWAAAGALIVGCIVSLGIMAYRHRHLEKMKAEFAKETPTIIRHFTDETKDKIRRAEGKDKLLQVNPKLTEDSAILQTRINIIRDTLWEHLKQEQIPEEEGKIYMKRIEDILKAPQVMKNLIAEMG